MLSFETILLRVCMSCMKSVRSMEILSKRAAVFDEIFMSKPESRLTTALATSFGRLMLESFFNARYMRGVWLLLVYCYDWKVQRSINPEIKCSKCDRLVLKMRKLMESEYASDLCFDVIDEMKSRLYSLKYLPPNAFDLAIFFLKAQVQEDVDEFNSILNMF